MKELAIIALKQRRIRHKHGTVEVALIRGRRHKVTFKCRKGKPKTMILRFNSVM